MNITIKDAVKTYNGITVLNIRNLEFKEGYIYAILGLNGSGKSTLLECISGIKELNQGSITLRKSTDSRNVAELSKSKGKKETKYKDKQELSIMVQKPYLFNTSVLDNIISGLKFRKLSKDEIDKGLEKYLKYFDMESLLDKNAKRLSGGEASRTALLRTAVLETEITILDEPTASMDMESTLKAEKLIKDMARSNRSVIMVTHDIYQAGRIADYIIFMDKGEILEMGEKEQVLNNPRNTMVRTLLNLE